jgi:hypothetical protein
MHKTAHGGSEAASKIAAWVAANFTAQAMDDVTRFDLRGGA